MDPVNDSPRVLGNRYEVGEVLGRGGMAEVHIGRDTRLGRTVAIKLLRSDLARDPVFQARFRREALSAASLNHPAIVAVYDTAEEQVVDVAGTVVSLPYIVMEYVHGRTVRDLVEQARTRATAGLPPGTPPPPDAGALDISTALDITTGVLSALEYSHRAGIVHRDIKPANVMITPAGEIKVMDFGIARALADASATMTQTQAVIGTAQYLSPEQARGETVDARSDLYSAGCLLYEVLTGRPPFVADSPVAVAYQHVREYAQPPSTLNPAITEDIDRIVMHALTKDRDIRYQTAAEFRYDVEAARAGRRVAAPSLSGGAAATEYLGAQGAATTALSGAAVATAGASVFPGDQPPGDFDEEANRNRGIIYAAIALAVLAVAGLIGFVVFNGPEKPKTITTALPDVSNMSSQAAEIELSKLHLTTTEREAPSDTVEEGTVIKTEPVAGTVVPVPSEVVLVVSSGPDSVEVPDVKGMDREEAIQAIQDADLVLGDVQEQDAADTPAGEAIGTKPGAGTPVERKSSVILVVASGKVTVPNVVGKKVDDARKLLEAQGFQVDTDTSATAEAPPGTVLNQDPQKDSLVDVGSRIRLLVAVRPEVTTTTPAPAPTTTTEPAPVTTTEPAPTTDDGNGNGGGPPP
jgi:serine/threonine-protein kinase